MLKIPRKEIQEAKRVLRSTFIQPALLDHNSITTSIRRQHSTQLTVTQILVLQLLHQPVLIALHSFNPRRRAASYLSFQHSNPSQPPAQIAPICEIKTLQAEPQSWNYTSKLWGIIELRTIQYHFQNLSPKLRIPKELDLEFWELVAIEIGFIRRNNCKNPPGHAILASPRGRCTILPTFLKTNTNPLHE